MPTYFTNWETRGQCAILDKTALLKQKEEIARSVRIEYEGAGYLRAPGWPSEYGPFGEALGLAGQAAALNPFRFSTKFTDATRLVYYPGPTGGRYFDPGTGRWLSRDTAEESGGVNLYGFCNNDPENTIDVLGMWPKRPDRDPNEDWAKICAEDKDTWQDLATQLSLDASQASKWVNNYDSTPKAGKQYELPNTVVVYTSSLGFIDRINVVGMVRAMQGMAVSAGGNYAKKNYKIIYKLNQSSESTFTDLWKTSGIFALAFGGHGSQYGFVADRSSGSAVSPDQVAPPYKLQAIGGYSRSSADKISGTTLPAGATTMPLHQ